ncbi:MAG: gliding motility-associated C-terminal domain-containing protein [Bacteroidota bacterium]
MRFIKTSILAFFLLFQITASGSHYMGGEITWDCLSNGNYRFHLRLYRECNGITYNNTEYLSATHPSITSITMTLVSQTDISPDCNTNPVFAHIDCYPSPSNANTGAVEEWYFTSDAAYPSGVTLAGVPPAQGWIFSHSDCCRNPCSNIIDADNEYWFLRAVMYSYNGQNASPCFDNSPTFAEKPSTVICTSYPFTYNHNAWDKELDSLSFEWAQPLTTSISTPVTGFVPGYSYSSPLPGTAANPNNVPATVNPYTGEISFTSFTQGAFVTVTKVTAYKCGIKVAEIFREMQIVLLACGSNSPPVVTAPFPDPGSGLYTLYSDTVYAGELVAFPMSGTDFEFLPDGNPQTLHLFASGSQFGANYTSTTTGCLNPPCAILNPAPLPAPIGLAGQFGVQTNFSWQTDCSHLATNISCLSTSNVYNFVVKVQDDFCPAPAISWATITVVVLPPPILSHPDFRCVAVDDISGDVTLTWVPPVDTVNSFNSYHIYSSTSASGPFTVIDSIFNYTTTSYTDVGAGGNTQPVFYYLKTRSSCDGSYYSTPSDTLETIFLYASNSGTGTADLIWNPIHNPDLPTSMGWYHIYREYPPGTWTLIDSTQQLQYSDTITLCNAQLNYYVDIDDSLPCTSVSNIDGDVFQDETEPFAPVIDSVSVDSLTGYSVIGWTASSSGDTEGYIIYEYKNGIWVPIDTVWGYSNTFYVNSMPYWSNPDSSYLSYQVAAFDSCDNTSPISINHSSIFLTSVLDICNGGVTLNWTPYINMLSGLEGYRIYVKENNGPYTLLATNAESNLSFYYSPLTQYSTYVFSVQAFDISDVVTSTSNCDTVYAYVPDQPQFVYLRYVTVRNNDYVELKAIVDTSGYIANCKIMRAEDVLGPFTNIGNVAVLPLSNTITYNDASANVSQLSYVYKVIVEDSCGNDTMESNIGQTILLTAEADNDMKNNLSWNEYAEWLGDVSEYRIYRAVDEVWDLNPIVSLSPGTTEYVDDISQFMISEGKFGYYVEALEGPGNPYLFSDTSISNEAIALQPPRLYVPNAFSPKGLNTVFIPVSVFVDAQDYQFTVYNRWGLIVFQTTDINTGWDGTFGGELTPQGVYVYAIQYKNSQNKFIEKHGTVTLLR